MCAECRQNPCHPCCPNAPETPVACKCIHCGDKIYEGEDYYNVDGEEWCETCIKEARTCAGGE